VVTSQTRTKPNYTTHAMNQTDWHATVVSGGTSPMQGRGSHSGCSGHGRSNISSHFQRSDTLVGRSCSAETKSHAHRMFGASTYTKPVHSDLFMTWLYWNFLTRTNLRESEIQNLCVCWPSLSMLNCAISWPYHNFLPSPSPAMPLMVVCATDEHDIVMTSRRLTPHS
jgi:hypothetical protein